MNRRSNTTPPPIIVPTHHWITTMDYKTTWLIQKYCLNQKYEVGAIAAALTGSFLGAFGHIWFIHRDNKEVMIRSNFGMGMFQEITVSMEIIVFGGMSQTHTISIFVKMTKQHRKVISGCHIKMKIRVQKVNANVERTRNSMER